MVAACSTLPKQEQSGMVIGGVLGGVLGSRVGHDNGRTAATIIGAVVGGAIGGNVGRSMDNRDRTHVGGKTERMYGTACRQPDGSWHATP